MARRRSVSSSASSVEALAWPSASTGAASVPCGLHKQSVGLSILTGNEGLLIQLLEPALAHEDSFSLLVLLSNGVPLRIGVFDQLSDVLIVASIEDVKKIFSHRKTALRQLVGKVPHEVSAALHLRPQSLHTDFVIVGHVNKPHSVYLKEFLLLGQDLSEEVFIEHGVVWQVELNYTGVRREKKAGAYVVLGST